MCRSTQYTSFWAWPFRQNCADK